MANLQFSSSWVKLVRRADCCCWTSASWAVKASNWRSCRSHILWRRSWMDPSSFAAFPDDDCLDTFDCPVRETMTRLPSFSTPFQKAYFIVDVLTGSDRVPSYVHVNILWSLPCCLDMHSLHLKLSTWKSVFFESVKCSASDRKGELVPHGSSPDISKEFPWQWASGHKWESLSYFFYCLSVVLLGVTAWHRLWMILNSPSVNALFINLCVCRTQQQRQQFVVKLPNVQLADKSWHGQFFSSIAIAAGFTSGYHL